MEWLFGLAILPLVLCGLMCVGGMALAAMGMRRGTARRTCGDDPAASDVADDDRVSAQR